MTEPLKSFYAGSGGNDGPFVDYEARVTINLGNFSSKSYVIRYARISAERVEQDLKMCEAALPIVVEHVNTKIDALIEAAKPARR